MPTDPPHTFLLVLWEQLLTDWDNDAPHEAFLLACDEAQQLALAARLYREKKDNGHPEQAARADQQLSKVVGLAISQIESRRHGPVRYQRTITILGAVVSLLILLACMYVGSR